MDATQEARARQVSFAFACQSPSPSCRVTVSGLGVLEHQLERAMAVSILEALMNAQHNLRNPVMPIQRKTGMEQLDNAVELLLKGYGINEEVEPILNKYGSISNVPDKSDN